LKERGRKRNNFSGKGRTDYLGKTKKKSRVQGQVATACQKEKQNGKWY